MTIIACWCGSGDCEVVADALIGDTRPSYALTGSAALTGNTWTTASIPFQAIANATSAFNHGVCFTQGRVSVVGASLQCIAWTDADNYAYVEVTFNGSLSTLKIWEVSGGGSAVQLGNTVTITLFLNAYYEIELCWNGVDIRASINVPSILQPNTIGMIAAYTTTHSQAGFGTNPNGGTTEFERFNFNRHHVDIAKCNPCELYCCSYYGNPPETVNESFRKLAPNGGGVCTPSNGPWALVFTRVPQSPGFPVPVWSWSANVADAFPCCLDFYTVLKAMQIGCLHGFLGTIAEYDVTKCERHAFGIVPDDWIIAMNTFFGPLRAKTTLLSCVPFHLLFQFQECIYDNSCTFGMSQGTPGEFQGWEIEVTE